MFTHLHVHTEYSMLDGLSRLEGLVERTVELGMDSLAITDHGGMYGAIDFYQIAKKHGVKPIIGCEMYVAPSSRHERNPANKSPYHMTVLSHNERGYDNLIKLVTKSNLEGFYYKPRIDREALEQHSEGLILLSGCPSGEVPRALTKGDMATARAAAAWYKELLEGRYYLELMSHGDVPELPTINKGLMELHRELDIPLVATNDSHYTHKHDAPLQDILICIQTNTNVEDEGRLRMEEDSYYLRSPQEMAALWVEIPDAISNTQRIAEMCELELDFSRMRLPQYPVPKDAGSADDYLADICRTELVRRIPNAGDAERQRLDYELDVIRQTQFADYFLVVWDIAKFVHERDIFFAVRGSAAASLVLYCLGVTDVNPLPYRLVFERFLNVERKEMPDIDMDFQDDRREEVINYVVDKYGREHVAQIITFGTFGAKAAIRDSGRALAMPYGDVDRVARLVPTRLGITITDAIEQNPEMKEAYDAGDGDGTRNLVDTAIGLEGLTRHTSTHAAAVVISQEPLTDIVPLQRPTRGSDDGTGVAMTQYAMEPCADLGLLKMDFLGLSNLAILARARNLIAHTRGQRFSLTDIPLDDGNTFALLSRGDTVGVFQMEGSGMTRYIKELKPSSLGDVAAMIALYRPGPMDHISTFIDSKHGRTQPNYPHPALKDILEETYGVIVYQDQVLQIARTFAGYTLGEADIVRKAMGKKIPEIMAEERERFITGALEQGYSQPMAEQIFALIEPFAGYAFNKAHSVSYGLISYWTAYLKANFTAEYMVALLNSFKGSADKIVAAIAECRRLDIPVLPPSVNKSDVDYSIETTPDGHEGIRIGLSGIKNVGEAAVAPLVNASRKHGGFDTIENLCQSGDIGAVGKKTLESLIRCGALDDFGDRSGLLDVMERILTLAQSEASRQNSQQASMFDMMGASMPTELVSIDIPDKHTSDAQKGQWEQELLGMSTSNNTLLDLLAQRGKSEYIVMLKDLDVDMAGKRVKVTGLVSDVSQRYTRENKPYAIATLTLMDGTMEVFIWDDKWQETQAAWVDGKLIAVTATVRARDDQLSLSCLDAEEVTLPPATTTPSANASAETARVNGTASVQEPSVAYAPDATAQQPQRTKAPAAVGDAEDAPPWDTDSTGAATAASVDAISSTVLPKSPVTAHNGSDLPSSPVNGGDPQQQARKSPSLPKSPVTAQNGNALPSSPVNGGDPQQQAHKSPSLPKSPVTAQNGNGLPSSPANSSDPQPQAHKSPSLPKSPVTAQNGSALPSSPVNGNGARHLTLRLRETNTNSDGRLLMDVKSVLVEHQGESEVTLEIATDGRIVTMEWPVIRVDASESMVDELRQLLGAAGDAYLSS